MSSSWTEQILAEAREIGPDDFIEPDQEVCAQDHPAGQAPLLARQLWTLAQRMKKQSLFLLMEKEYGGGTKEHKEELSRRSEECQDRANQVREIFWSEVKEALSLWGKPIGLRSGWVVVWQEEQKDPRAEFLGKLFGMGGEK